jgi:RNA polymerase subunit RPABC4/transcription elongation factor Spt4
MPLKQCPECKQEVSETAKVCPHCGYKKPPAHSPVFLTFLILVVCGGAAVAIILGVHAQKMNRAKAELDETLRGAAVYTRLLSLTPTPRAQLNRSTPDVAPADQETKPATTAAAQTPAPQFVTITQPVLVGSGALPAGTPFVGLKAYFSKGISARSAVLPAGTRLDFVSQVGDSGVLIRYKGGEYIIPASATDLK